MKVVKLKENIYKRAEKLSKTQWSKSGCPYITGIE